MDDEANQQAKQRLVERMQTAGRNDPAAAESGETMQEETRRRQQELEVAENDPEQILAAARALVAARHARRVSDTRRKQRLTAAERRRNREVRKTRGVELPKTCVRCGTTLPVPEKTGRPKLYCSDACRKAAYEDRRAKRPGAVQVRLVEKTITEVVERRVEIEHETGSCVTRVICDPQLTWRALHDLAARVNREELDEDDLTRIGGEVEYLYRVIAHERTRQMWLRGVPVLMSDYRPPRYSPWKRDELRPVMEELEAIQEARDVRRDDWFRRRPTEENSPTATPED